MTPRRLHFPRRFVAAFATFTLAISGVFIVLAAPANATPTTRPFTSVFTANTTGDVIIRGNTLETCLAGSVQAQGSITCASAQGGASQQNNNYFMTYVDADGTTGGNTTFDSSSANITVPTGATVLYAGLSWGAVTSAGALTGYPALTGVAAPDASSRGNALFQAPGASSYSAVTSTTTDNNQGNYQAYADVTSTVKAAGSGIYTVANVQAGTGGGNYAGWSLAVAYSAPNAPLRNLTVFTGYNQVSSSTPSVDIPVSGFLTPATGAVATNVGVVAYEGDKGSTGDGLSIGSTALYNSLNPINDVFNSSITDLNVAVTDRTPSYANTLGFDIDRFDATGALANGSTSTVLHYTTANPGGETYYPGMLTFATNLSASALTATKTVTDATSGSGVVSRNDRLNYSITVTNGGGDGAAATVLTDAAPAGTTYAAGSLKINGTTVSDATGDDAGDVTAGNVTARLGSGATSSAGGTLAPAASATVTFSVFVNNNSSVVDGAALVNTALFTNQDQTTGTAYSGGSNTVTSNVVVPPALSGTLSDGEVTAPYSSGFTLGSGTGTGPFVWTVSSGPLPAGLAINASTGLITGTPTAAGGFPITVQVVDANSRSTTRSQTINVNAVPVVTFTPPTGEATVAYSAQPTVTGGTSPYTWSVSAGTLPAGLTMNSSTGLISGTPTAAAVGTTNITVQAVDASNVSATKAVAIVIVAAPALTFSAPPAGEVTAPYSNQLTYTGGVSSYTWSVSTGSLPAGLTLNASTGLLSGTPTTAASSTFTVKIVDGNGLSDTRSVTLVIGSGPTVTFSPPTGEATVAYSTQPTATGGTSPYTWSVSAGTLPAGLTISPSTGRISGTPTAAGTTNITVQAVDANFGSATSAVSIVIVAVPTVTFAPPTGEATAAYSAQPTASGGTSPYTWSVSVGNLPDGLTISPSTGRISGTPTAAGSTTITVQAVDANSVIATQTASIVIGPGPTVTFSPPTGEATVAYSAQPTATGGTGPYTWSVSVGTLPNGLTISPSTGRISGTPTAAGTTNITVQALDANFGSATSAVSIVVVAVPAVTFTPGGGEVGAAYSAQPTVSGGTSPYTWSVSGGTLPDGLTISPSTGRISGTPTTAGSTDITVQTVDANSVSATKVGTITVIAGPAVAFTAPAGEATLAYAAQPTVTGGTGPYTWSVSAGTLPDGLTISPSTGRISGTPTTAGSTDITVQALDAKGANATKAGTITIVAAPSLTFTAPPAGELGAAYTDQLTKSGGVGTFTWSVSAGSLPTGLSLDTGTGLLSGTPTATGSFDFTVKIVDGNGVFDTKDATVVIAKTTTAITLSAPASVTFGTSVTLSAAASPSAAGGTVTFTDVPTTGPQSGTTVVLGSPTLSSGGASVTIALPAFGVNAVTAHYNGDSTHAAADSSTKQVEVSAYPGEVIVTEFRESGPSGVDDSYIELFNTGATVPLAGIVVSTTSGSTSTLPANAGYLGTRRSYLITGSTFSLGSIATSDFTTTLGTGGIQVVAPDTAQTQTDAVGPSTGFHLGNGLPDMTGPSTTAEYAWVRKELGGAMVDTHNNANDFVLVSRQASQIRGVPSTYGSSSPIGTADPYQTNAGMTSTLLDPGSSQNVQPNRVVVSGSPGTLTVRRTITNTSGATITSAKVRVTALSEVHGEPEPGVSPQPATIAQLWVMNPGAPTQSVMVGGVSLTVHNLSLDVPADAGVGGLNSTLTLPLPNGGLAPGATINVAFTFAIDRHGTFWFGYDIDAISGIAPGAHRVNRNASQPAHASPRITHNAKPGAAGQI